MSSSLSPLLPMRRRTSGLAQFILATLAALPLMAPAQVPAPAAAPAAATDTTAAPANTGGGRRGGRGGAGGFQGGGGRGGRRGGGAFAPAAGTDNGNGITTQVALPPGGAPGAAGAIGGPGNGGGGPPATVAVVGSVPNPDEYIIVNMSSTSAQEVIDWLQRNTGKIILQDQDLPGGGNFRIIFSTDAGPNNAMLRKDAVKAVETLLSLNGVVISPMGDNMLHAEAATNVAGKNPPMATDELMAGEPSGLMYYRFFHLDYITPQAASARLTPFLGQHATLDAVGLAKEGTILIEDTLMNLQTDAELLKHFDRPVDGDDEPYYKTLVNASAQTVVTNLTAMATGPLAKYFSTTAGSDTSEAGSVSTFAADTRTNSIIVFTNKGNREMIKKLIDQMDVDVDPTTKTQVFSLKQAVANTTATLLNAVVTGVQGATGVRGGGAGAGAAVGAAAAAAPNAARDQQFSPYVTIQSDTRTNSIVAYGTPSDLRQIGSLIDQVDIVLPQVHIDAVVTEVTLTKDQATGLSAFNVDYGFTPANGTTSPAAVGGPKTYGAAGPTAQSGITQPAFSINGILTGWNLNTVFNVAQQNSNVKVLSNPSLTVTHNALGLISVGERIPTINSSTTTLATSIANNNVTSTVSYTNVTIELQVIPFIGKDGSVYMNISQNVSDVVSEVSINGNSQPIIGTRNVTSFVTVHDGDVLVLGGLRQRSVSSTHGIMFLLGEIPILGTLFQPDTYDSTQRELIVFIKPTIIKGNSDAAQMGHEMAENSPASDLTVKYLRDHNLASDELEAGTAFDVKKTGAGRGPSPDHSPNPPPATPPPAPAPMTQAAPTPAAEAPSTTTATSPSTTPPAETPANSSAATTTTPTTSTQPTITSGGFSK